jgi:pSer/pThr/pTyr-binding forkhead associated (FHA) protein
MKPYALVYPNIDIENLYIIKPGEMKTIGRGKDCGIRLTDPTVSRHHAKIDYENDGTLFMWDLGSENGTFYKRFDEEERITTKTQLFRGDIIRFGTKISLLLKKIDLIAEENKTEEDTQVGIYLPEFTLGRTQ